MPISSTLLQRGKELAAKINSRSFSPTNNPQVFQEYQNIRNQIAQEIESNPSAKVEGNQIGLRIADIYLGTDSGGSFLGAVSGFGGPQQIQSKYGGLQGLAKFLVEGGTPTKGRTDISGGFSIQQPQTRSLGMNDQPDFGLTITDLGGGIGPTNEELARFNARQLLERGDLLGKRASEISGVPFTPVLGDTGPTGDSGASGGVPGADLSGLPPEWAALYTQLEDYLKELEKRGQILNPNIEITSEKLAEFTKQAEQEIDPFFKNTVALFREQFLREQGFSRDEILRQEEDLERQFGKATRRIGEEKAEVGFALSGGRIREERDLAEKIQRGIEQGRRNLAFQAGGQALQFGSRFGAGALPSLTIGEAPRALAGARTFERGTRQLPFYELSPDVLSALQTGTQTFEQRAATQRRASELEELERSRQSIAGLRSLTL